MYLIYLIFTICFIIKNIYKYYRINNILKIPKLYKNITPRYKKIKFILIHYPGDNIKESIESLSSMTIPCKIILIGKNISIKSKSNITIYNQNFSSSTINTIIEKILKKMRL